jgi:alkylation response protein AidB-like acyl-CoA dehydrogenase
VGRDHGAHRAGRRLDVGASRTTAELQPDGTWHLRGVKRFITSAEWDWPENIFHLVLARPVGIEGVGGPGTKGLSLFLVSKHHVDLETGALGERNGVAVTGVEKKMGLKVSTTCEVTFGDAAPAVGTLVGGVHDGIAQMFQVIENARMFVGAKAISTLSTGYLNSLEYAKTRVQGADLTRMTDKTAPRVTITHHPDVRLMLMRQKAWAEGLRALVFYTASQQDRVELTAFSGEVDEMAERLNDLLLPIVKGYGSRRRTSCWPPRCRCSAAPASPRTTRSSSTSGTPRSTRCTRGPPPSRGWTSSSARSSGTGAPPSASCSATSRSSPRPMPAAR